MHPAFGRPQRSGHRSYFVAALLLVGAWSTFTGSASAQTATAARSAGEAARVWVSPAAGDALRGAALYQTHCTACHAIDSNKTGPAHRGVMGRRVGSLPGYRYSEELARSRLRWTPQTLNLWLEDPEELVAGQRMGFQVDGAQERADLIAYLATLK
jgi:cytochrome c